MLTVVIATRNRAALLRQVLNRYCELEVPAGDWRSVIVDNGNRDNSRQVVESFAGRIPAAYVLESRPGKNAALRTGFPHAEGDLVIFSDDDTLPCRDWLMRYERAARELPDFTLFGGPVRSRWPRSPAAWITANAEILSVCFSCTDPSRREGPIETLLVGSNFAVRRAVFRQEDFNPGIGPVEGVSYAMGSESDLLARLEQRGCRKWCLEAATFEHMILPEQMDRKWVLRRALRAGRGQYRVSTVAGVHKTRLLVFPRWMVRQLATESARWLVAWIRGDEQKAFEARWKMNRYLGILSEAYSDSRTTC